MKRFFMFCAMLATLCLFSACEKNQETSKNTIIGKWQLTHVISYTDGKLDGKEQISEDQAVTYEFLTGSTGVVHEPDAPSWFNGNFSWKLEGTLLTMYFADHTTVWTVKKLTDNFLSLEQTAEKDNHTYLIIYDYKKVK